MIRNSGVFPEPLSPRMVRNSPSAICREMSRSTGFFPKDLATLRMTSRGCTPDLSERAAAGSVVVAMCFSSAAVPAAVVGASRPHLRGQDALGDSRQDAGATELGLLCCFYFIP